MSYQQFLVYALCPSCSFGCFEIATLVGCQNLGMVAGKTAQEMSRINALLQLGSLRTLLQIRSRSLAAMRGER